MRVVARALVERHRLGLGRAGLEDHHLGARRRRRRLEVGEHPAGDAEAAGRRDDVHPLDLGGLAGAERLDVVAQPPGTGGHRLPVAVGDEEGCRAAARTPRVERGVVGAAVADDVLGLDLRDEPPGVLVAPARRGRSGVRVVDVHRRTSRQEGPSRLTQ